MAAMPALKLEVPLQVEIRRVVKAASGRPGKAHVIVNRTLLCDPITWQSADWFEQEHERVGLAEFKGRQACIICFARLHGVTVEKAKELLAVKEEQEVAVAPAGASPSPALWINGGEIWPSGDGEIHYIVRGPDGWERHKVVHSSENRKHFDPRLFDKLSEHLNGR